MQSVLRFSRPAKIADFVNVALVEQNSLHDFKFTLATFLPGSYRLLLAVGGFVLTML